MSKPSARSPRRSLLPPAVAALAAAGLLSACQASPDSWGTGVVKQTDAFGDYSETVVAVPKPTAGPRQFQCAGPFAPNTTAVNLAADFGQSHVVTGTITSPDGSTAPGVVLLPNDPGLALEIAFKDSADLANPRRVAFTEGSQWTVNGIGIGASVADLERANGRAFRIQGFSGAGGGVVADWQGGRLADIGNGCQLNVQLALPATVSDAVSGRISGPRRVLSSSADVRAANPTVGLFWVTYR